MALLEHIQWRFVCYRIRWAFKELKEKFNFMWNVVYPVDNLNSFGWIIIFYTIFLLFIYLFNFCLFVCLFVLISTTTTWEYTNFSDIIEVLPLVMRLRQHPDMVINHEFRWFRWPLQQLPFLPFAVKLYTCMVPCNLQQHLGFLKREIKIMITSLLQVKKDRW